MFKVQLDMPKFNLTKSRLNVKMNRSFNNSTRKAADFMIKKSNSLAPVLTGKLVASTNKKKIPNGHRVFNTAQNNGFPYPKWVNQSPGFVTLTGYYSFLHPLTGKLVEGDEPRTYGSSPSHWTFRGTPKFWDLAIDETEQRFNVIVIRELKSNGVTQ